MEVAQWLGKDNEIGKDIWTKKYQNENESLNQWFDRISGGNEKIKQAMIDKKFLFGGRILANRGLNKLNKKITLSNCFTKGHKITTQRGLVNIEEVQTNDFVLSEDNQWHRVNDVMDREYSRRFIPYTRKLFI